MSLKAFALNFREILSEMWKAHSLQTQRKILSKLKPLGKSIFQASFEKNFDALSLGMELAKVSPAGIIGAWKRADSKVRRAFSCELYRLRKNFPPTSSSI
jgi:hypothetical protein